MHLTSTEIAKSFGEHPTELHESVLELIEKESLVLNPLTTQERDLLIIDIIDRIQSDKQVIAAEDRTEAWRKGWSENLELFRKDPDSDAALVPKFVRPGMPIRWFQEYYRSNSENFELSYINILRQYVITKYFTNVNCLYEFGAGTGFNLLHAHKVCPELELYGTDFVQPAVDLINEIGIKRSVPLVGSLFNMLSPSSNNLELKPNSAVWTFGSLEQLGGKIKPMFDFLIENKPSVCVHIEPVVEFYEKDSLPDYLAKWFQSKRGYTAGLVDLLNKSDEEGKIKILKLQRLYFGSKMMEGYNLLVWQPVK